jgi:hypothetical protein
MLQYSLPVKLLLQNACNCIIRLVRTVQIHGTVVRIWPTWMAPGTWQFSRVHNLCLGWVSVVSVARRWRRVGRFRGITTRGCPIEWVFPTQSLERAGTLSSLSAKCLLALSSIEQTVRARLPHSALQIVLRKVTAHEPTIIFFAK